MLEDNTVNKQKIAPAASQNKKSAPRLSLSLHTMPQSSDGHFKKWLFLGVGVLLLLGLVAYLLLGL